MLYAAAVSQRPIFYWKHGAHLPGQMLSVEAEVWWCAFCWCNVRHLHESRPTWCLPSNLPVRSVMQLVVMQLSCHSLQVFRDSAMELLYGWQLIMNVRENPLLAATWHLSHEPCECRLWPIVFVVSVCLHFQSQQSVALFSLLLSAVFWHQSVQPCANAKWRLAMELPASRPAVSLIARQKRLFFIDCLKKKYPWLSDKTVAQLFPDEDIMFLSKRAWETKALHARQFAKFVETFIE